MRKGERLSEHFMLEEMCYSRVGVENGIDNIPEREAYAALKFLVTELLEPLRRLYGQPVVVTSGYRSEEVNRLVGGVPGSQHTKGEAADCYVPDTGKLLAVLRQSGLEFDQAIHYRKRNFLHLSLKRFGTNRMQVLLRLLVLVVLMPGCGGSRKSQRQEVAISMDSVRFASCETGLWQRNIHLVDTAAWNVRRVDYFAPDSTGRQYPKAVSTLQMDYRRGLTDTGKVMVRKQDECAGRRIEVAEIRMESSRKARSPGYFLYGGILLFAVCLFWYKRLRSRNFFPKSSV